MIPIDDDGTQCKEVYAHFGVAYYMAECVHRGLGLAWIYLSTDHQSATRPWVEERIIVAEASTMGEVASLARPLLPASLHEDVSWAVERRNYLAHGFWSDRNHHMFDHDGRVTLVAFLSETTDRLQTLSHSLDALCKAHWPGGAISEGDFEELCASLAARPPDANVARKIPKTETRIPIERAWLMPITGVGRALILADGEGTLWQLAERGLGWCLRPGPELNWEPFAPLQSYLPAEIIARPKSASPWDYALHISTGALLRVWRDPPTTMRFSVRPLASRRRPA